MRFKVWKELVGKKETTFEIPNEEWEEEIGGLDKEELEQKLEDLAYYKGEELLSTEDGEHVIFKVKKI